MDLLKSVAALADKYDCASALYHPATVWLEAKVPEATSPGFESLLAVAIQLDTPLIFTKTSRELIHGWDGSYKKLVNKDEVD